MRRLETLVGAWLPVAAWVAFIFAGSTETVLVGPHVAVHRPLPAVALAGAPGRGRRGLAAFWIRKAAHVSEYAVLAALLWRALLAPVWRDPRPWSWPVARQALVGSALWAASDEIHQAFTATRGASVRDVVLDSRAAPPSACCSSGVSGSGAEGAEELVIPRSLVSPGDEESAGPPADRLARRRVRTCSG